MSDTESRVDRLEGVVADLANNVSEIRGAVSVIAESTKSIQESTQQIARVDEKHNALTIDTQRNWEAIERVTQMYAEVRQDVDECKPYVDSIRQVSDNIKKVIIWGITVSCLSGIAYTVQQAIQQ